MDLASTCFSIFYQASFCQAALADLDLKQVGTGYCTGTERYRVLQRNESVSCIELFLLNNSKLLLCANSAPDF
jgi:hypothetical protein